MRVRLAFCLGFLLSAVASVTAVPGDRSPDGVWVEVDRAALGDVDQPLPTEFHAYRLNLEALKKILASAPHEGRGGDRAMVFVPLPDGTFTPVAVEVSPVLGAELAAKYPTLKTFTFDGVADTKISGRMTLAGDSFQAILRPPDDFARISPLTTPAGTFHLSFLHRNRTDGADNFRFNHDDPREPHDHDPPVPSIASVPAVAPARLAKSDRVVSVQGGGSFGVQGLQAGGTLRVFRMAASTTGEYYQAMVGPNGDLDVVAAIVAEVNNANLGFETEFAVRMQLDWAVLYNDPTTDAFTTINPNSMPPVSVCNTRDENVAAISDFLDPSEYDIGFAFSQGGGNGCAWYVVCLNDKERGAGLFNTGLTPGSSTGLILHEMAHQLGARHTFSSNTGSCGNPGEFNQPSAFEPGSGSTISSYFNACAPNNVDTSIVGAGFYFHAHTFEEVINNITSGGGTCGASVATGNTPPTVDAGSDYTIPRGTPFELTGSGSDPDGDGLLFTWEQYDVASGPRNINTDPGDGPLFRSVPPTATGDVRTFPNLTDILSNTVRNGEFLPVTDRTMSFRLTARDNRAGGGGISSDDTVLTVTGDPFFITSPNGGEVFGQGCPIPTTWTVGGGSVANLVNLGFSDDGGNNFDQLFGPTANDGAASPTAPCTATGQARLKAAGAGNVFFDVSNNNFSVVPTPPEASIDAVGGAVDQACTFKVQFTAAVQDDCGLSKNDVVVKAFKQGNNFTMGPVEFMAQQTSATLVDVMGSVLVSDVSQSPAVLMLEVTGADACGIKDIATKLVQVVDNTPPSIDVTVSPTSLWAPNHKMEPIVATVQVTDNCPGVSFALTSVTSNEPDNGLGDGDTSGDIQDAAIGTPDTEISLRAERQGSGNGRIYTVTYAATDASNNGDQAVAVVVVPKSQKK
jgi:hypothetical protein